ncbi:hypothetical protein [Bacillus sp. EAC]|uniref:hypothetical protein n=1 Tax=Bacillus sp. EAC TaxID=1978338 RepID=UPI000B443A20|nr:hypothetical protein [Bacillus sp. EAC]
MFITIKLICRTCKIEVSEEVEELKNTKLLYSNGDQEYIRKGFYILDFTPIGGVVSELNLKDFFIINIEDSINSKPHINPDRLIGCCGLSGVYGHNIVCINNHEIGIKEEDCSGPHYVALDPELVKRI